MSIEPTIDELATGVENIPLSLYNGRRRDVTFEHLPNRNAFNVGELNTKANDHAQDQRHHEELKTPETPHRARRVIKNENYKNIDQCEGASCNQRNFDQNV